MTAEERLDALEQELRRSKRTTHLLLVMIGVAIVAGVTGVTFDAQEKGVADEVRARTFILEDKAGKPRARLGMDAEGPALHLLDSGGKSLAVLSLHSGSPSLILFDASVQQRAALSVHEDGSPFLTLSDEKMNIRVLLSASGNTSQMTLSDVKGNARVALLAMTSNSIVSLYDPDGKSRAKLVVDRVGDPWLTFIGANGKELVDLRGIGDAPALRLLDRSGIPFWQTPEKRTP
jgi:hypothetical protein